MKKLYETSEIWFAVGWILIYVIVMGNLKNSFGDESIITLLGLLAIAAGITFFIVRNGLTEKYGLKKVKNCRKYLYFVPFVFLAAVNFWAGVKLHYPLGQQITAVLSMALVGYAEEIIFRGLLFKAIEKENVTRAIIISAVTFGAGHIVNLLTGQSSAETFLQMAYAIAIGFTFVMVFHKSGSLVPCIITHSLIDMTSTFSGEFPKALDYFAAGAIIVVAGGYALYLRKCRAED